MRARLLQVFILMYCSATLAACSKGVSDVSGAAPTPTPAPTTTASNDKLPACAWGTSNWGGCNWQ